MIYVAPIVSRGLVQRGSAIPVVELNAFSARCLHLLNAWSHKKTLNLLEAYTINYIDVNKIEAT
jgi:hypothetical protein